MNNNNNNNNKNIPTSIIFKPKIWLDLLCYHMRWMQSDQKIALETTLIIIISIGKLLALSNMMMLEDTVNCQ